MSIIIINRRSVALRIRCLFPWEITALPGTDSAVRPADVLVPGEQMKLNTTRDASIALADDGLSIQIA
jgi:hypothetical protein